MEPPYKSRKSSFVERVLLPKKGLKTIALNHGLVIIELFLVCWQLGEKNETMMFKFLNLLEKNKKIFMVVNTFFKYLNLKKYCILSPLQIIQLELIFISDPKENGLDKVFLVISQ